VQELAKQERLKAGNFPTKNFPRTRHYRQEPPITGMTKNRNDSVAKSVLSYRGVAGWRREMNDLVRYRAMESLCRQNAVFRPLDSWRLLAEAEMWHHKAQEEIASLFVESNGVPPAGALVRTASRSQAA
jgi:hypothetical protein